VTRLLRLSRIPGARRLREPWTVLVPLAAAQWVAVAALALSVRHNGWLFYQGGDQTFFYTDAWAISGGHVPEAEIGYGWSYVLSPIARVAGPSLLGALPAIVLLQTALLLPIALYCVYEIAGRIAGRPAGYLAAAVWVVAPFAAIPLWQHAYHDRYVEQLLPQALGLTGLGDFPSMVCLLVAALFCMRALDTRRPHDGVLAGLAAGFAIGIKPANALFLAGPFAAFAVARRSREGLGFGLALVPGLAAFALWKYRGLGHLPVLTPAPRAGVVGAALAGWSDRLPLALVVDRYVRLDWSQLSANYRDLREYLWGVPVLLGLPLAGFAAAAAWRAWSKALLLAAWLLAFVLVKGTSHQASIASGTLLRLIMPGFPPFLILTALIPLLVPRLGPRVWRAFPAPAPRPRRRARWVAVAAFTIIPILLFAVLPPLRAPDTMKYFGENVMVPVDRAFSVGVHPAGTAQVISWRAPPARGVHPFYRVFRSRPRAPAPDPSLPPGRDGIRCLPRHTYGHPGAADCRLEMSPVGVTRSRRFVDRPPPGPWVYRVGLAANWRDDPSIGDVLLLSRPGQATMLRPR
jgi:hypothetical protein